MVNNMTSPHKPYPRKRIIFDSYPKRPMVFGFSISHAGLEVSLGRTGIGIFALRVDFDKIKK